MADAFDVLPGERKFLKPGRASSVGVSHDPRGDLVDLEMGPMVERRDRLDPSGAVEILSKVGVQVGSCGDKLLGVRDVVQELLVRVSAGLVRSGHGFGPRREQAMMARY